MFKWRTIKEDYFNPIFKKGYQYIENDIKELIKREGLTYNIKHDLRKCLLDMAEYDIPYRAFGKIDASIMYFFTDLRFIIFQRKILKEARRELE